MKFLFHPSPNSAASWRRLRSNSRGWRRGWRRCGGCRPTSNATAPPSSKPPAKANSSPRRQNWLEAAAPRSGKANARDGSCHFRIRRAAPCSRILAERRQNWQGRGQYKEPAAPDTTNLGPLPEGWTWATFEQIAARVTVGFVGSMKHEYVRDGVPFLRGQTCGRTV